MSMQARCPKCKWRPGDDAEWPCVACGYHWDLFSTAGRCPQCGEQQETVYCIEWQGGCGVDSDFLDWFDNLDDHLADLDIRRSGS